MRKQISVVLSHQVSGNLVWKPSETNRGINKGVVREEDLGGYSDSKYRHSENFRKLGELSRIMTPNRQSTVDWEKSCEFDNLEITVDLERSFSHQGTMAEPFPYNSPSPSWILCLGHIGLSCLTFSLDCKFHENKVLFFIHQYLPVTNCYVSQRPEHSSCLVSICGRN